MRVETRRVLAEGVWQVVFVVFLAYAMMPLKTWVAALFGLFLPVVHVVVAAIFAKEFPSLTWQQVSVRHQNVIYFANVLSLIGGLNKSSGLHPPPFLSDGSCRLQPMSENQVPRLSVLWSTVITVEWKRNLVAHGDAREEK